MKLARVFFVLFLCCSAADVRAGGIVLDFELSRPDGSSTEERMQISEPIYVSVDGTPVDASCTKDDIETKTLSLGLAPGQNTLKATVKCKGDKIPADVSKQKVVVSWGGATVDVLPPEPKLAVQSAHQPVSISITNDKPFLGEEIGITLVYTNTGETVSSADCKLHVDFSTPDPGLSFEGSGVWQFSIGPAASSPGGVDCGGVAPGESRSYPFKWKAGLSPFDGGYHDVKPGGTASGVKGDLLAYKEEGISYGVVTKIPLMIRENVDSVKIKECKITMNDQIIFNCRAIVASNRLSASVEMDDGTKQSMNKNSISMAGDVPAGGGDLFDRAYDAKAVCSDGKPHSYTVRLYVQGEDGVDKESDQFTGVIPCSCTYDGKTYKGGETIKIPKGKLRGVYGTWLVMLCKPDGSTTWMGCGTDDLPMNVDMAAQSDMVVEEMEMFCDTFLFDKTVYWYSVKYKMTCTAYGITSTLISASKDSTAHHSEIQAITDALIDHTPITDPQTLKDLELRSFDTLGRKALKEC